MIFGGSCFVWPRGVALSEPSHIERLEKNLMESGNYLRLGVSIEFGVWRLTLFEMEPGVVSGIHSYLGARSFPMDGLTG
jgi:hypothetical protein